MRFKTSLKLSEIKPLLIFGNEALTQAIKDSIKFEIYLNGVMGNGLAGYDDFMEFLEIYRIDPNSKEAAMAEMSFPIPTVDGVARFKRVAPSDEFVNMSTGVTLMFNQIKREMYKQINMPEASK